MTSDGINTDEKLKHYEAVDSDKTSPITQDDAHSCVSTVADLHSHHEERDLERVETTKQPLVKVPRSQRRGLFARFAIIPEVTEPVHYSNTTKWLITVVVAIAAAAAPVGSAIILPALNQVADELHSSPTITNLSVALYMLSMAIFPLWWSSFSETLGRRSVYLTSFAMFTVFGVLSAISKNITMLVIMRMLNGGAAASVQAVGAGTIADVWESFERGRAMGYFYLGPLCGPLFAPILGGVIGEKFGWRATQWALSIYGVLVLLLIFFALPETLQARKDVVAEAATETNDPSRPPLTRSSTRQSVQQKSKQYAKLLRMLFVDPLSVLTYLRFPLVLLCVYYSSVTFGSLYLLNISIQYSFEKVPYEFPTIILGLLYIPNSLGYILASLFGGKWMDRIMAREARKRQKDNEPLVLLPEDRMRENAWLGALIYPAALIWYGWTVNYGVIWIVPMIANFFYGIGSMLIFAMSTTMLTEFMPKRSSSGVAVNNFCRNIFSCAGAIAGAPLINAIGNGWVFTILGLWTLSSAVVVWAIRRFGPRWRKSMDDAVG
ncbi:hypothetical protein LTS08_004527 [Lithohypha guttulata]|nr:hypothetical protein LTS08_004527 [Lithohypha guttulata]